MVGMAGKNCDRSIQLLAGHHPHELVRPSHRPKADDPARFRTQRGRKPVRASDQDRIDGICGIARLADLPRPFLARPRLSPFIEGNQYGVCRGRSGNCSGFSLAPVFWPSCARLVDFAKIDASNANAASAFSEAAKITLEQLPLRPGL